MFEAFRKVSHMAHAAVGRVHVAGPRSRRAAGRTAEGPGAVQAALVGSPESGLDAGRSVECESWLVPTELIEEARNGRMLIAAGSGGGWMGLDFLRGSLTLADDALHAGKARADWF